jgi:hypothetical protein
LAVCALAVPAVTGAMENDAAANVEMAIIAERTVMRPPHPKGEIRRRDNARGSGQARIPAGHSSAVNAAARGVMRGADA